MLVSTKTNTSRLLAGQLLVELGLLLSGFVLLSGLLLGLDQVVQGLVFLLSSQQVACLCADDLGEHRMILVAPAW